MTENERIPDVDEIIDAQLFAGRMIEQSGSAASLLDLQEPRKLAEQIVEGAKAFYRNVMNGLTEAGIDTSDAVEMLLTLRRLGGKRLEEMYGPGTENPRRIRGREPVVQSSLVEELEEMTETHLSRVPNAERAQIATLNLSVLAATTDVHEHGKMLLEQSLRELGVSTLDGGVSTDADKLAAQAGTTRADAIAVSTFNGIALDYVRQLKSELNVRGLETPILVGGRLNQIPDGSNTSLPVDVSEELSAHGAIVCNEIEDCVPALIAIGENKTKEAS